MSTPNKKLRKEVLAEVIKIYFAADEAGRDPRFACQVAFPGIPDEVITEAWLEIDEAKTEAWWKNVERTIEGEIIRNALAAAGAKP